jgi:outer membrane beta-barrel protein
VATAEDSLPAAATAARPAVEGNPRLTGRRMIRLEGARDPVARSGPGETFAVAGVFRRGDEFPVVAKSGSWFNVRLSPTETGWFHASLCREFDDLADLEFRPNPRLYSRTGAYTLTGYAGAYAFDQKSNSFVAGGRLGYYVFDRVVVEGGLGWTHVRRPAEIVESLFGLSLEAEDFHMLFYHLAVTWELLPGRQMVPFLTGGVGSAILQGESEPGLDFGAGTTLFLSRRAAVRWEIRDHQFEFGSQTARRRNHNIAFTMGTTLLF